MREVVVASPIQSRPPGHGKPATVVGLGANLGPARENLARTVEILRNRLDPGLRVAPLYRSAPIGPAQPDFLNSAVAISGERDLRQLLGQLQAIEKEFGRQRNVRWGPRTLDLDILWASYTTVVEEHLTVPHPRLYERAFALLPLLDLERERLSQREESSAAGVRGLEVLAHDLSHSQHVVRVAPASWDRDTARP